MNEGKIITRYAKAVFQLAIDKNMLEPVSKDMESIFEVCKQLPEFKQIMGTPVLIPSKKIEIFDSLFAKSFNPLSLSFYHLVINHRRELFLSDISRMFLQIYRKHKGIKTATLTTAIGIDEKTRASILQSLKCYSVNNQVVLNETIEPKIIGGFILNIDDMHFDASVSSSLTRIKRTLLNTSIK